jgi:restriction endonuclease S subunit
VKDPKDDLVRLIQIRDYKSDNHIVYIPKDMARRFCDASDVMIGRYGPPLFQILKGIDGAYNVALMKAVPNERYITKDFLYYFLKNGDILKYIIDASSRAAGQIGLNKETLEPYPISFPSKEAQGHLVSKLINLESDTRNLAIKYEQKLQRLAELKLAILQKAFSGELTALPGAEMQEEAA